MEKSIYRLIEAYPIKYWNKNDEIENEFKRELIEGKKLSLLNASKRIIQKLDSIHNEEYINSNINMHNFQPKDKINQVIEKEKKKEEKRRINDEKRRINDEKRRINDEKRKEIKSRSDTRRKNTKSKSIYQKKKVVEGKIIHLNHIFI